MTTESTRNGAVSDPRDRAQELDALLRQHAPTVDLWLVALAEFHRDRLWQVMGYPTWAAWAQERIGKSHATVYRLIHQGYALLPAPTVANIPRGVVSRDETITEPSKSAKAAAPGRPLAASDKAPRYVAKPTPEPTHGPLALPPTDVPDASTIVCHHCGGTGRVPRPSKPAPSLNMAYYCANCGRELRYFSPRCPQCRQLDTVRAR